jgi:hypothetical protein
MKGKGASPRPVPTPKSQLDAFLYIFFSENLGTFQAHTLIGSKLSR